MIDRPDQVWCADSTYIPVLEGFFYLLMVIHQASRYVQPWRLPNTMKAGFCIMALEATSGGGSSEISGTDLGSRFTNIYFTERIQAAGVICSMYGDGRYLDNIFIERLWLSLKYEAICLLDLSDGYAAESMISEWVDFYNHVRPHLSLDGCTSG